MVFVVGYLPMDTPEDNTYEILEAVTDRKHPLPAVTRKRDGFTRQEVVNAFARAFEMIGGVQRMALWANQNPDKFYPLYSKLLPSTAINIGNAGTVIIEHAIAPTPLDEHPPVEVVDVTDNQE